MSGDPTAIHLNPVGLGISLSSKVEQALFYWVLIDSHLCAARLNGTVSNLKDRDMRHCLFVDSAYTLTDCSSDEVEDEIYKKLSKLHQKPNALR